MTTSTIELYEALVHAGVDETRAKAAASAVLSREEGSSFVSQDRLEAVQQSLVAEIRGSRASVLQWVATMLIGQAALISTLVKLIS